MNREQALGPAAGGVGRRELLSWGLMAASAALTAKLLDVGLRFAQPRAAAGEFGGQFDLGTAADLPDLDAPPVNHPAGRFFLVRTDAGVSALYKGYLLPWDQLAYWAVTIGTGRAADRGRAECSAARGRGDRRRRAAAVLFSARSADT
jgi:hypothetical protein